ncbi:ferredoxin [Streptomyces sp. NPDC006355]|uniref:ferredoxin n=1 Tax=Streptomyces sp. NPDC006355 TaxID=3156758 RepID=UPI0033A63AF3
MRIEIDPGRCMGSGQCVIAAGAVFDQSGETGEVILLGGDTVAEQQEEAVRDAIVNCPSGALSLAG